MPGCSTCGQCASAPDLAEKRGAGRGLFEADDDLRWKVALGLLPVAPTAIIRLHDHE